jgi:hypothetical protein
LFLSRQAIKSGTVYPGRGFNYIPEEIFCWQ